MASEGNAEEIPIGINKTNDKQLHQEQSQTYTGKIEDEEIEQTRLCKEPSKDETEVCKEAAKCETEVFKNQLKDETGVYKEPAKNQTGVCMVGLHCCGDLTPTMLHYFAEVECVRGLCCVSCCYHRMKFDEASNHFENFPMSRCVQEVMSHVSGWYPGWSLNTYAMRLAAQETRMRWLHQSQEEHDFHTKNVAYRALLELCLIQGPYVLKKTARKLAHRKDHTSYEQYLDSVAGQVEFPDSDGQSVTKFKQHMMALYQSHQQYFTYIEPFTALQFLLQPVLESLIYTDRKLWLQEHGYHGNIIPIFDEFLSPRNLALVAIKC